MTHQKEIGEWHEGERLKLYVYAHDNHNTGLSQGAELYKLTCTFGGMGCGYSRAQSAAMIAAADVENSCS